MPAILVLVLIFIILLILVSCIRIVPQAQAMVVERLGAYLETWNVGIHFKVPFIDRVAKRVLLKEQVVDFAPQPVITKIDNNEPSGVAVVNGQEWTARSADDAVTIPAGTYVLIKEVRGVKLIVEPVSETSESQK